MVGRHVAGKRRPLSDPWIVAVIVSEIAGVVFLLVAIPGLLTDVESLAQIGRIFLELLKATL